MALLDSLFGSAAMAEIWSDAARFQRMLDVEAALARAEAQCGIISDSAAAAIEAKCKAELIDLAALANGTALSANPVIPLVKQLTALVANTDPEAARFVHWGATSQDINDTALVLQIRQTFDILEGDLERLSQGLADLAGKYRSTPIAGRTLMQQAMPTTLGVKIAGWLDAVIRHRERFAQVRKRVLAVQFGGAVGTLAALSSSSAKKLQGLEVAAALAKELSLELPIMPWHSHRDRMAEVACVLGVLAGTMGKIARDISLHAQTEIAEILEPAGEGRGGSSTMPHKRNPVSAAVVLAAATRVPALVSIMLSAMIQEDERGLGNWHAEWETLPEIFRLTAGALHQMADMIPRLEINTINMRRNLDATHGLIFAEAVAMALGNQIGKSAAHKIVEEASRQAAKSGTHLRKVLEQDKAVTGRLSVAELDRLFAPENYMGSADELVDRVLADARRIRK